jgi:hypothetical protein
MSVLCVAEALFVAHHTLNGLIVPRFCDQPADVKQPFLWAALAATGAVDQVRRDVARHRGIGAATTVFIEQMMPSFAFCERVADAAMIAQQHALEGLTSNQPIIRAIVARIQALRPAAVSIEATAQPGGETVTMLAEVTR